MLVRILVTGGRDFTDYDLVIDRMDFVCSKFPGATIEIVHGGARGADHLVGAYSKMRGYKTTTFMAEWDIYGKAAGPVRNTQMIATKPTLVVAFPGGRGTADMCRKAADACIPIFYVFDIQKTQP
jgi:hypothetical protein